MYVGSGCLNIAIISALKRRLLVISCSCSGMYFWLLCGRSRKSWDVLGDFKDGGEWGFGEGGLGGDVVLVGLWW